MNKLDDLFSSGKKDILNIYCTAGYPRLNDTGTIMLALQESGADIIELGIAYSDPVADGPVIQQSNMQALANGISIAKIFEQLNGIKDRLQTPVILMGYFNPVLQFGIEAFCAAAAAAGVSGVILPDLPMYEFEQSYRKVFDQYGLHFIFLISPQTSEERIRKADKYSKGFLYAVSSSATTGQETTDFSQQQAYYKRLQQMKLSNPVLIGFGIKDKATFQMACSYASGAIIGSAFIKALANVEDVAGATAAFVRSIKIA